MKVQGARFAVEMRLISFVVAAVVAVVAVLVANVPATLADREVRRGPEHGLACHNTWLCFVQRFSLTACMVWRSFTGGIAKFAPRLHESTILGSS